MEYHELLIKKYNDIEKGARAILMRQGFDYQGNILWSVAPVNHRALSAIIDAIEQQCLATQTEAYDMLEEMRETGLGVPACIVDAF